MEMRNYNIPKEIIENIMKYNTYKILIYENIQMNKEFLFLQKNGKNKQNKNLIKNYDLFISKNKLDLNLIHSNNNKFVQNPEYSFFKIKRESFRNENVILSVKKLEMEINEKEIYEEIDIEDKDGKDINSNYFFY